MRFLICLPILTMFLASCADAPGEGKAAAILDQAQPEATAHARSLTSNDVSEMRRTGLRLITLVQCWPDGCE